MMYDYSRCWDYVSNVEICYRKDFCISGSNISCNWVWCQENLVWLEVQVLDSKQQTSLSSPACYYYMLDLRLTLGFSQPFCYLFGSEYGCEV